MTLERTVKRLMRAAREALVAQDRYHYWTQFGTSTPTEHRATARWERAQAALEAAEADAEEALFQMSIGNEAVTFGRRGGSVTSERKAEAARENGKKGGRPPQDSRLT